jgi:hypothetical protein
MPFLRLPHHRRIRRCQSVPRPRTIIPGSRPRRRRETALAGPDAGPEAPASWAIRLSRSRRRTCHTPDSSDLRRVGDGYQLTTEHRPEPSAVRGDRDAHVERTTDRCGPDNDQPRYPNPTNTSSGSRALRSGNPRLCQNRNGTRHERRGNARPVARKAFALPPDGPPSLRRSRDRSRAESAANRRRSYRRTCHGSRPSEGGGARMRHKTCGDLGATIRAPAPMFCTRDPHWSNHGLSAGRVGYLLSRERTTRASDTGWPVVRDAARCRPTAAPPRLFDLCRPRSPNDHHDRRRDSPIHRLQDPNLLRNDVTQMTGREGTPGSAVGSSRRQASCPCQRTARPTRHS